MTFEIFRRFTLRGYRWFFRLVAANGEIIAQSQAYKRHESALDTVQAIILSAPKVKVLRNDD